MRPNALLTGLPTALLLAMVATPAAAIDPGRLLPMPEVSLPDWLSADAPAASDLTAPRRDAAVAQPVNKPTPDATTPAAPAEVPQVSKPASRLRGWRSLLPGSIK